MPGLTIQVGSHRGGVALCLRGSCTTAADASHLDHAIGQLLANHPTQVWVDCQQLQALSWLGQRAWLGADNRTRAVGTVLYWCGLPSPLRTQLDDSGLGAVLHLRPAEDFQEPRFLRLVPRRQAAARAV